MTIPLVVLSAAIVMTLWESVSPGRSWPKVAGWWARALALNAAQLTVVLVAPRLSTRTADTRSS